METSLKVQVERKVKELFPGRHYVGMLDIGGIMLGCEIIFEIKMNDVLAEIQSMNDFRRRVLIKISKSEKLIETTDKEYFCFFQLLVPFVVENEKYLSEIHLLKDDLKQKGWLNDSVVFDIPKIFWELLHSPKYTN